MGDNFAKNRALVERIEAIAEEKDCTPAQLCLAWLLAQGPDVISIPGTRGCTFDRSASEGERRPFSLTAGKIRSAVPESTISTSKIFVNQRYR
jgi:diketogulonate reductase-like aldo/keto reductase